MDEHIPINESMMPQIKKPFYQKWWFGVIFVIGAVVILALVRFFGDPVRNDLTEYLEEDLAQVEKLESELLELYEEAQDSESDQIMYEIVLDEVLPKSRELIEEAEAVEVETPELREIHEIYIEALNLQDQGLLLMLSALENQDVELMTQVNAKLDEARKLSRQYRSELKQFAKEHGHEISFE